MFLFCYIEVYEQNTVSCPMPLIIWGFILPIFTIPMIMPHCPYSRLCSLLSSLLYLYMYPRLFLKYTKFKNFLLLMVLKNYFHMNMKLLFPKYFFLLKICASKVSNDRSFQYIISLIWSKIWNSSTRGLKRGITGF